MLRGLSRHDSKGRRYKEKVTKLTIKIKKWHRNVFMDIEQSSCDITLSEIFVGGISLAYLAAKIIKIQKYFVCASFLLQTLF